MIIFFAYHLEFVERYLSVKVFICFNDCPVYQLLKLHVRQVGANHHLQHCEQFSVRNVPVVVDVVDLERKLQFLLLVSACRQRVKSLHELKERYVAVFVLIEHGNHSFYQRVLGQL